MAASDESEDKDSDSLSIAEPVPEPIVDTSFVELINQLAGPKLDVELLNDFFLTYRSICAAEDLLAALVKRFLTAEGPDALTIRKNCVQIVGIWVDKVFSLFSFIPTKPSLLQFGYDFILKRPKLVTGIAEWNKTVDGDTKFSAHLADVRDSSLTNHVSTLPIQVSALLTKVSNFYSWPTPSFKGTPPKPAMNAAPACAPFDPLRFICLTPR